MSAFFAFSNSAQINQAVKEYKILSYAFTVRILTATSVFALSVPIANAVADDTPPTQPVVSIATYSDSASEVFWTRSEDDSAAITYSLLRNGQLLFSGDGLSYFDASLIRGERYVYEVLATGADGLSVTSERVTLQNGEPEVFIAPVTPTGLRASIYSDSALELFWDRMGDNVNYFVYQNGALLNLTDGTSAFINSGIAAGGRYNFEVQTRLELPRAVLVSERASVQVSIADPGASVPLPVSGLSLSQYSGTAAELFWDRPPQEQQVSMTEVFRNGQFIGETQGTSFYDENRLPGSRYRYDLVAVNSQGLRSDVSTVQDLDSSDRHFTINEDNVEEFAFNMAQIFNGAYLDDAAGHAFGFVSVSQPHPTLDVISVGTTPSDFAGENIVTNYNCSGGGSVIATEAPTGGLLHLTSEISDCVLDSHRFNGQLERSGLSWGNAIDLSAFEIIGVHGERTIVTGSYSTIRESASQILAIQSFSKSNADGSTYQISEQQTRLNIHFGPIRSSLESSWSARGPFSKNITLTANTTEPFQRVIDMGDFPVTGRLNIVTEEGLSIYIEAANDDPATFDVVVYDSVVDSTRVYTVPWTDRTNIALNLYKWWEE